MTSTTTTTPHRLLNDFNSSKPSFGAWMMLPGTFHARAIAQSHPNLSWILIDCEHGLTSLVPGAAEIVAAISTATSDSGPSAIVRIPATGNGSTTTTTGSSDNGTSWQIKYALDSGARGVLVPMVGNASKAKEIVQDSRFPPQGRRGFGSPFANSTWGMNPTEYRLSANQNILVMVQIESLEGVENLDEIVQVGGVDVLFIGPTDLSISLGYPLPTPDIHPDVEVVIQRILKVCKEMNKKCGIFCSNGIQAKQRAEQGFDMINVTVDMWALQVGLKNEIDAAMNMQ